MQRFMFIFYVLSVLQTNAQQNFVDSLKDTIVASSKHQNVYTLAEKMAEFPGGPKSWVKYLQRNLDYNIPLKNNAPPGRYNVIVMFIIHENGWVSDLKPVTNHGFGMEAELVRLIEKGPPWIPAMQNGKPVKSYRKQPVIYIVPGRTR